MRQLNLKRMRLLVVGVVVAMIMGSGSAKADFTFGEPTNLGPIVNGNKYDDKPCISADGLSLYFTSGRDGGYGYEDIWLCTRPTMDDPWGPAENVGPVVNSALGEFHSTISTDELELYFERWDFGQGTTQYIFDIWVAKRTEKDAVWGQPVKLDLTVPNGFMAGSPSLSGDGLELYFGVYQFGDEPQSQLYVVKRKSTDAAWGEPASLGLVVNSWSCQAMPMISRDGLLLTFNDWFAGPLRPNGFGNQDVWFTRRTTKDDDWGSPVNLGSHINTAFKDRGGQISADGAILYFSSDRPSGNGSYDLWQAPILSVVDFDGDGIVEFNDLTLMVESWGTDDPRYDIGPMPWGDGTVDAADLDVLMASWGQAVDFPYDPGKASKPMPADGSTKPVDELRWTPGCYAVQHDVYLGQDPGAVENADISDVSGIYRGRQDSSRYTPPGALDSGATFFWRIDEIHTDGTIKKGPVWNFTVADLLVVDDFENYIAEGDMLDPRQIWMTWIDGWDDDQNGSQVGYANPPWVEQTIVHGGLQSMPFFYDNSNAPISRTFRECPDPEDWTARGIQVLTLWLYGEPDNAAEPFYVGLEDSAGNRKDIAHPDPVVLTVNNWQQWRIPLADFTDVDMTAIKIMYIGVGDPAGNQPGGSGLVRIDDIELHRSSGQ